MNQDQTQPINLQEPTQAMPSAPISATSAVTGATQNQQLDPTIVNMARAIKSVETAGSSDPYTASGKSGEYGAYQFMPQTWSKLSQQYLGQDIPVQQASVAQQNQVAYNYIKSLKDQGYNPAQVASIWNSGKPDPTGNVGTNKYGAVYNTPQYVQSVVSAYNNYKNGLNPSIQPTDSTVQTPQQQPSSSILPNVGQIGSNLGQQLQGKAKDISQNIGDIAAQLSGQKGSQGWWSDLLQTGGDIAGGIGDVINAGLQLVPGVQAGENWVGGEIGKAADTQVGQQVVKAIQGFQQAHPELSKDIGAGFNIVTAIPILKGLGAVKNVAMSGLGTALKGFAEKGITNEITGTAARTVAGRNALQSLGNNLGNVIDQGIIKTGAIPDIVDGKYVVSEALAKNEQAISNIAQNELQPLLDKVSTATVADRMPLEELRQQALSDATNQLQDEGAINKMFDRIQKKYGDYPTLAQLNEAKKIVSQQVPQRAFDLEGYNANYNVRQILQKSIETGAQKLGLPDVNAINGKMRLLYQANDLLSAMDGKPVKVGLFSKLARKGVSVGAGMLANQMGGGVLGGLGAGYLTDIADKGIQGVGGGLRRSILERVAPGAFKQVVKKGIKRTPGALTALLAQKQVNQ